jgi:hypothetical protein
MRVRWWLENAQVRFCESLERRTAFGRAIWPLAERELCDTGARVTWPLAIAGLLDLPGVRVIGLLREANDREFVSQCKRRNMGLGKVTRGAQKSELQRFKCMMSDPPGAVLGPRGLGEIPRQRDEKGYKSAPWLSSQDRESAEAGT